MTTTKLVCPECQHENEQERVYCHSCGARLDRSAVAPSKEPAKDTRQRVRKLFDPQRARMRLLFFQTSKMILGAAALALVLQMILPPDVPEPPKSLVLASQIRLEMEGALERRQPAEIRLTEEQVNGYLQSGLRTKQSALDKPVLQFKRAFVAFREGVCTITMERSCFGYPLYSSCGYAVALADGKINASVKGGGIGRLKLHPKIMQGIDIIFSDLWGALDRDVKLVAKFGALEFHDKTALLKVAATQ